MRSIYDKFIERNVETKRKSSINSVITRRQLGRCCDWCASLVGSYEYASGKYPADIFKRHANCRCMVTVKTDRSGYTDVWSKKEYASQKEARMAREEQLEEKNEENFLRRKRIEKNRGKKCIDSTEYYAQKKKVEPADIGEIPDKFTYKGNSYEMQEGKIFIDKDEDREKAIRVLSKKIGGKYRRFPRIYTPKNTKTPDLMIDDIAYDVKRIEKGSENRNALYNACHKKKEQAQRFIFDITDTAPPPEEWKKEAEKLFYREGTKWLEEVVLISGEDILAIISKI